MTIFWNPNYTKLTNFLVEWFHRIHTDQLYVQLIHFIMQKMVSVKIQISKICDNKKELGADDQYYPSIQLRLSS